MFLDCFGHSGGSDLFAIFIGDGRFIFAQFFSDRVHLAAQEVFTLLLLCSGFYFGPYALPYVQFSETLLLELQRQLQTLDDIQGFQ